MLSVPRLQTLIEAFDSIEAALASFRPRPPARAALEERRFPAFDGGCLALRVPQGWREEIVLEPAGSSVVFRAAAGRPAAVTLSFVPLTPQQSLDFSIEDMRREVESAGRAAGAAAIEVFAGSFGGGFYFCAPSGGAGQRIAGRFLARPVVVYFTIEGRLRRTALEMLRGARALPTLREGLPVDSRCRE
jgi:hypothetical protein